MNAAVGSLLGSPQGRALRQTLNITREVLCELGGGLQEREKLDVILMGAALAILSVTAKEVGGGGGA